MIQFKKIVNKYFQIFKISFAQEFAYKVNFIMWRVRNVIQVLIAYYLWSTVFADPTISVFGYDRAKILTYIFGMILIRALVFSARSVDVPQEISEGSLSNYLVRPMNYFKFWFTRDASSKALNFAFSIVEFGILALIFTPPIFFQTNPLYLLAFLFSDNRKAKICQSSNFKIAPQGQIQDTKFSFLLKK